MLDNDACLKRLRLACSWIADVAQVKREDQVTPRDRARHRHDHWVGALRGEYKVATASWAFFCPVWHTGQAVKALVMASGVLGDEFMESALLGGRFLMQSRVIDGPDRGLIHAFEDHGDIVNTSAILECLEGLFNLSAKTGDRQYAEAALEAMDWVQRKAVIPGTGLVMDLYNPEKRVFIPKGYGTDGRPLADDAAFLTAYRLTGREEYLCTARAIAEQLLVDEKPAGNWVNHIPCDRKTGLIHPRHAYWWGRPMLEMFKQTGDVRFRDLFIRSCDWYRKALRRDGGLLRNTYEDFSTDSFGHATSGVAGAVLMFQDALTVLGDESMKPWIELGLSYCLKMQFTDPEDPDLRGCILEKVLAPDGTDASPYYIRDLGTIFFVQAMARQLGAK